VSISHAQRAPLPNASWVATVHHGLPENLYQFRAGPGRYLAVVGRMSPEKRVDLAIDIARQVGLPLVIAAKVEKTERTYFEQVIRPRLSEPGIEFVGEVGEREKQELLGGAIALLFPIDWPEPFGLVMIEALACGTPVVALRRGSVPEVLEHGVSGFVVDGPADAVRAVEQVGRLSRRRCRLAFERRFTARRMTRDYLAVYTRLMEDPGSGLAGGVEVPGQPEPVT
jgi:glycosyltransferase involved in cell wall biosynthesis